MKKYTFKLPNGLECDMNEILILGVETSEILNAKNLNEEEKTKLIQKIKDIGIEVIETEV